MARPSTSTGVGAVLVGDEHPDACIGAVAGSEERQPLHVVPVQMA